MTKRAKKNYNSLVIEMFGEKPIAFNPMLARMADSALAGLFLSQILYWWGKGSKEGYVFKTIKEAEAETHMNRSEQDRAIKILKRLGVIEVRLKGIPQKRHFQVKESTLLALLERVSGKRPMKPRPATQSAELDILGGSN